jgi:hypothetical protein
MSEQEGFVQYHSIKNQLSYTSVLAEDHVIILVDASKAFERIQDI